MWKEFMSERSLPILQFIKCTGLFISSLQNKESFVLGQQAVVNTFKTFQCASFSVTKDWMRQKQNIVSIHTL
jgi:hypothetical protein